LSLVPDGWIRLLFYVPYWYIL